MASDPFTGFRLSPRQRYLWPLGRNVQARAEWKFPLAEERLAQAVHDLINRHEILRTVFRPVPELRFPLQVILEEFSDLPFKSVNLSNSPKELENIAAVELAAPFDLENSLPIRFTLLKLAPDSYTLLVTAPAISTDSYSFRQIFGEISRLYSGIILDEAVQFVQVSEWQNEMLEGETGGEAGSFWREQQSGAALRLPLQLADQGNFQPARFEQILPTELVSTMISLSWRLNSTLSDLLFTSWFSLLENVSGRDSFTLGYESSGRDFEEMAGAVGPIAQALPIKLNLSGLQFAWRCQEAADRIRQAIERQEFFSQQGDQPFSFAFHDLIGLGLFGKYTEVNQVDGLILKLTCLWEETTLRLIWRYNSVAFKQDEILRLAGQYLLILKAFVDNPQAKPGQINLVNPAEAHQQTVEWNETGKEFEAFPAIHNLFEEQVRQRPQATAVVFGEERLSFAELNACSNKLAHFLTRLGVGPEKVVGICLERSTEMVVALLAVLKAGGAYLPLDPRFPAERLAYMLKNAGVAVLLTQQSLLAQLNRAAICLDGDQKPWLDESEDNPRTQIWPENPAYVIYTSGSTGQPKGVTVEHRQLINYTQAIMENLALPVEANYATVSTIAADLGNTVIYPALCGGGCLHIISWDQMFDSTSLAAYFERNAIDCLKIVPSHLAALLAGPQPARLMPRRCLVLGGESWDFELGRKLQSLAPECRVLNHYGPTETTVGVLTYPLESSPAYALNPPLGRPLANLRVYVLNRDLEPVPVGSPGEIYIGGTGVTRGYLGRPDLTAEKFLPDPYNPGGRIYRTGDLGRFLPGGLVEFLGRTDNQVKVRGFRVELGEIEQTLRRMSQVRDALVVAQDQKLVAYLVAADEFLKEHEQQLYQAQLQEWQQVFNETHGSLKAVPGLTFNSFGWNSSYTGQPLPEAEIREQVDFTVRAVLDQKPGRVLEIGCGTGLLLFGIAPQCREYWGTDFSQPILNYTREVLAGTALENVRLLHQTADDFDNLPRGYFDAVILNSVAQYFPGVDYLAHIIQQAIEVVRPGGFIFLGDIRSLPLLEAFHTSVQVVRGLSGEALKEQVRQQMGRESELILDPGFFQALARQLSAISQVEISLKRGRFHNELTAFRYDVMLRVNGEFLSPVAAEWQGWQNRTLAGLREMLVRNGPQLICMRGIPNGRITDDKAAVDPEDLWSLGEELGRPVRLNFSEKAGSMDALFYPANSNDFPPISNSLNLTGPLYRFANFPLQNKLGQGLAAELRPALEKQLPDYMLPAYFVLLREIPLNQNGKVDHDALPLPLSGQAGTERPYVAPRNPVEEVVAATWAEVLHFERVSVNDNFFELGGHSLLATQAVARLRAIFQVALPLKAFFEDPTVAGIARSMVLNQEKPGQIERIAEIWQRINRMSPEEVRAMLQRQKARQ